MVRIVAGIVVGLFGMALEMKGVHAYGYPVLVSIPFVMLLLWRLTPSARWPTAIVGSSFAVYVMHRALPRVSTVVFGGR